VRVEAVAALALLALLGTTNVEQYIAAHPPTVNERVDFTYLSRLSADGASGWQATLAHVALVQDELDAQVAAGATLSAKNRQDLAYAGLALRQVSKQYLSLSSLYASAEESQSETEQLTDFAITQLDRELSAVEQKISKAQVIRADLQGMVGEVAPDTAVTRLQNDQEELLRIRTRVQENEEALAVNHSMIGIHSDSAVFSPWSLSNYYSAEVSCSFGVNCRDPLVQIHTKPLPKSFFTLPSDQPEQQLTLRAKLLRSTISEQRTYTELRSQDALALLLNLQKQHFELYEGVAKRITTDSHSFETDISLQTPLLPELQ
jgi:hypothetical protein